MFFTNRPSLYLNSVFGSFLAQPYHHYPHQDLTPSHKMGIPSYTSCWGPAHTSWQPEISLGWAEMLIVHHRGGEGSVPVRSRAAAWCPLCGLLGVLLPWGSQNGVPGRQPPQRGLGGRAGAAGLSTRRENWQPRALKEGFCCFSVTISDCLSKEALIRKPLLWYAFPLIFLVAVAIYWKGTVLPGKWGVSADL